MLFEDSEAKILKEFRAFANADWIKAPLYVLSDSDETVAMITDFIDETKWNSEWTDASSKSDPPPDFYNNQEKIMLEVMRIDDHAYVDNRAKIQNPTNQKARKTAREMLDSGKIKLAPNGNIFVNAPTDLPTLEDHNYGFYINNFKRVIEKHIIHIPMYQNNHPGFKMIFFIYDESSAYFQVNTPNRAISQGERFAGIPHYWFLDKSFLDVVEQSGIDYLIWYTPYKRIERSEQPIELPMACVLDCNQLPTEVISYPEELMMSVEE